MKRTNTSEYKREIFAYLLECIYSDDVELNTPEEKVKYLFDRFESEYGHAYNLKRYPNKQERLSNWLQGGAINIAMMNYEIIELCEKLHGHKLNEKQVETCLANYFSHIAFKLLQLKEVVEAGKYPV